MIQRDILLMWYLLSIDLVIISFSTRRSGKQSILFLFKTVFFVLLKFSQL